MPSAAPSVNNYYKLVLFIMIYIDKKCLLIIDGENEKLWQALCLIKSNIVSTYVAIDTEIQFS